MFRFTIILLLLLLLNSLPSTLSLPCTSLLSLALPNTTILTATGLVPSTVNLSSADPTCDQSFTVPVSLCRLTFKITTSLNSSIFAEAWLPDDWNSRFLATGNGGLNGCIEYTDMSYGTSLGFATVGTNNGHNGNTGAPFENNPSTLEDFAWRALHLSSVLGKAIVEAYYGQAHKKSYYIGCSTGGRQGFKAVQTYPEDFDGVVAGAPAIDWNAYVSWGAYVSLVNRKDGAGFISLDEWEVVRKDIVRKCDLIDGLEDGIIDDPDMCNYRPEDLICSEDGNAQHGCLTPDQVETVRKVFEPLYGVDGELIFSRMDPGTEVLSIMFGGYVVPFSSGWFRYVVFNSSFDVNTLDRDAFKIAIDLDPFNISTYSPDLTAFRNRGGKIITYHGRQDYYIPAGNSIRYYNSVSRFYSNSTLSEFYQLFLIPGMGHCQGGPGAWVFGQGGAADMGPADAEHNVFLATVAWVENGTVPEKIVGTKYVNDTVASGVQTVREYCPYPQRSVWTGQDWECE